MTPRPPDTLRDGAARMSRIHVRHRPGWVRQALMSAGILPFFVFILLFLVVPMVTNTVAAFTDVSGSPTLSTMGEAMGVGYREAFVLTTQLALVTTFVGGALGMVLAWALSVLERPWWLRDLVQGFVALASQSGGVQLAYAFIAMLGTNGLVTVLVEQVFPGLMAGFSLTRFIGVALVYLYFQVPLMALLMVPSVEGLHRAWFEAAATLGATRWQIVRGIAIPILWPATAGTLLVLFANAFAAYATAYALAGGSLNLVPIVVGFLISGNVLLNPGLAAALVTWMVVVVVFVMMLRWYLVRRSSPWAAP